MRIQLDLDPQGVKMIEELKRQTGIKTHKDLFNNALTILTWAVQQRMAGRTVASMDEQTEKYRELQMPILTHAASLATNPGVDEARDTESRKRHARRKAAARGATLAVIHTSPGIATERNARRLGFVMAYTKVVMTMPREGLASSV